MIKLRDELTYKAFYRGNIKSKNANTGFLYYERLQLLVKRKQKGFLCKKGKLTNLSYLLSVMKHALL